MPSNRGANCSFAHGEEELRESLAYRTRDSSRVRHEIQSVYAGRSTFSRTWEDSWIQFLPGPPGVYWRRCIFHSWSYLGIFPGHNLPVLPSRPIRAMLVCRRITLHSTFQNLAGWLWWYHDISNYIPEFGCKLDTQHSEQWTSPSCI